MVKQEPRVHSIFFFFLPFFLVTEMFVLSSKAENKIALSQKGGIDLILLALKSHSSVASLQERACGALKNLAINGNSMLFHMLFLFLFLLIIFFFFSFSFSGQQSVDSCQRRT
jgi:hypothetical protein